MSRLALNGGAKIAETQWPVWPPTTSNLESDLISTVRSGRWTISGAYRGRPSKEALLGQTFADYCGARFGVSVCNGTHALVTAMEALGIGPGDEVIVPGFTWVADASAVLNINATPVLVDIDETLGLSPDAVEAAITQRTKAIIAVHLYCSMPNWDRIQNIASKNQLILIEDAAQAHGAAWRNKRTGTLGTISAFSFQQSKLLTSGEGGIALTDDEELFWKMKRTRCDGRDYIEGPVIGELEIDENRMTPLMGSNYCMSDVAASLLLSRLPDLDGEIEYRIKNMDYLERQLSEIPGVSPVEALPEVTTRPTYQYAIRVDRQAFANASLDAIIAAFRAEIGIYAERSDPPLNCSNLYRPQTKRRYMWPGRSAAEIDPARFDLPHAQIEAERLILLPHRVMMSERDHMDLIVEAMAKVQKHATELA